MANSCSSPHRPRTGTTSVTIRHAPVTIEAASMPRRVRSDLAARDLAEEPGTPSGLGLQEGVRPSRQPSESSESRTPFDSALVRLDPVSVQAVALAVVDLLRGERDAPAPAYLTPAEVALRFGVSRAWVYAHATRARRGEDGHGTQAAAAVRCEPGRAGAGRDFDPRRGDQGAGAARRRRPGLRGDARRAPRGVAPSDDALTSPGRFRSASAGGRFETSYKKGAEWLSEGGRADGSSCIRAGGRAGREGRHVLCASLHDRCRRANGRSGSAGRPRDGRAGAPKRSCRRCSPTCGAGSRTRWRRRRRRRPIRCSRSSPTSGSRAFEAS